MVGTQWNACEPHRPAFEAQERSTEGDPMEWAHRDRSLVVVAKSSIVIKHVAIGSVMAASSEGMQLIN